MSGQKKRILIIYHGLTAGELRTCLFNYYWPEDETPEHAIHWALARIKGQGGFFEDAAETVIIPFHRVYQVELIET